MGSASSLKTKRMIMFWAKLFIVLVQTGMYGWLWFHHYKDMMPVEYWNRGNWAVVALYGVFILVFSRAFGALKVGYLKTWDIMYSQVLTIFCVNGVTYLQLSLINGDWKFLENSEPMIRLGCYDFVLVLIWALFMRWIYAIIYPPHEMLLIYGNISPNAIIRKLESRGDKYHVKEKVALSAGVETIYERILRYDAVLIGDIMVEDRNRFIKFCFEKNIRCYTIPKISDIMIRNSESIDLFDSPLLLFRNNGLTYRQMFVKRAMDIGISALGIVLASPVMLLIAACIKLYDGGPVFYKQNRQTKDGKEFQILKFRSMIVDSERQGARLAKANDDRITPVGKVIRRLHFDELPQLFNILSGDMAFVGPRPERKEITEEYTKKIPEFPFRLKVKAGLTGYAQVYGQYNTVPYDKLKLDLTYITNYSIWLDIKLIILTVKILFQKEKSEGVDDGQKTALRQDDLEQR
ncbi:MAG: exopolysaccharide biosynthesis polyprenyl glycosylphosphotransferase [Eubacterium sp.]|jgi:exopolysaccharide biosynthesis polyprenyl glycosylphosphotransferase|nr:exopolysaccharide biosynthesis polyprenyl glycosylphosphotransferase [Eubacterium sp.]NBI85992.1 exopolysaccharide biosynthesis polyprenyl glycosylphosphotransferase [Lachnospiraceae bacterium]